MGQAVKIILARYQTSRTVFFSFRSKISEDVTQTVDCLLSRVDELLEEVSSIFVLKYSTTNYHNYLSAILITITLSFAFLYFLTSIILSKTFQTRNFAPISPLSSEAPDILPAMILFNSLCSSKSLDLEPIEIKVEAMENPVVSPPIFSSDDSVKGVRQFPFSVFQCI